MGLENSSKVQLSKDSISKFIEMQGIRIVSPFNSGNDGKQAITIDKIHKHISAINEFHEKTMGQDNIFSRDIKNKTGKILESCKINTKKLKNELSRLRSVNSKDNIQKLLFQYGEGYVERAERCFKEIAAADYLNIIRRSMKRAEICLCNVRFDNIRKDDYLEIVSLKKSSYDAIEMDAVFFFSYLKRKKMKLDWKQLVKEYCFNEKLSPGSEKFIIAMISYPFEFLKYFNRYRENKAALSSFELGKKIKKAMVKDGESLI